MKAVKSSIVEVTQQVRHSCFSKLVRQKLRFVFFAAPSLLAVTLSAISTTVFAAPTIQATSGTFAHNATVTVSGTGFGNHENYGNGQPFLAAAWNDLSSGKINEGNFYLDGANDSSWSLVTSGTRPNRTYALRKAYNGNRLGAYSFRNSGSRNTWFTSFWFKLASPVTQSGKFWRLYGSGRDNIYLSTGSESGTSVSSTEIRGYSESISISPPPATNWGSPNSFGYGNWHRVDILVSNASKSLFQVWMDGTLQFTKDNWVPTPFDTSGHTMDLGNMIDDPASSGGNNGAYIFSDMYFSHTQARVELGNAASWANSTVREIQVPTQWSSSSISIRLNSGAFSPGTTAYLYVVDAAGNASAGYPVTIGGVGSASAPTPPPNPPAPSGLRATTVQ